jgi:hypothetical protein
LTLLFFFGKKIMDGVYPASSGAGGTRQREKRKTEAMISAGNQETAYRMRSPNSARARKGDRGFDGRQRETLSDTWPSKTLV